VAASSYLVNNLKPTSEKERRSLLKLTASPPTQQIYLHVRDERQSGPISLAEIAKALNLTGRSNVQQGLDNLRKQELLKKEITPARVYWTVRPVRLPDVRNFRGCMSITVAAASSALGPVFERDEEVQLFLRYEQRPRVAALFRYLRRVLGQEVSKKDLAHLLSTSRNTLNRWLATLAEDGLVTECPQYSTILVAYADLGLTGSPDPEALDEWLNGPAAVPTLLTANQMLAKSLRKDAPADLIYKFYRAAMEAKTSEKASPTATPAGRKANELYVAHNLSRNYSFKELMGPLLFFAVEWNGENVDLYGRTLQTFSKNLPIILEEYEDLIAGEPRYVIRMMKRLHLDRDFPLPEEPKKEVKMSAKGMAAMERKRAQMAALGE
jgi:Mn-dependent DtxR family transcriptional regulator